MKSLSRPNRFPHGSEDGREKENERKKGPKSRRKRIKPFEAGVVRGLIYHHPNLSPTVSKASRVTLSPRNTHETPYPEIYCHSLSSGSDVSSSPSSSLRPSMSSPPDIFILLPTSRIALMTSPVASHFYAGLNLLQSLSLPCFSSITMFGPAQDRVPARPRDSHKDRVVLRKPHHLHVQRCYVKSLDMKDNHNMMLTLFFLI